MAPFREGIFSSLVTRLTLAVLAVLVLSLGVTTAVFVTQLQFSDRNAARHVLAQQTLAIQVRANVLKSLENNPSLASNPANHPLARMGALPAGVDRVLLTTWPDNAVAGDTQNDGSIVGPPFAPAQSDAYTIGGVDYVYRVLPGLDPQVLAEFNLPPYRTIVILAKVTPLPARAWSVVRSLALAGAIALLISLLAALVVLRAITRPLRGMTLASERMAAGDYDQQVAGAGRPTRSGNSPTAFNRMAAEVKRVREMQRQFVANVSHDLRSPLTSIIGFSQALTEDDDDHATAAPRRRDHQQRGERLLQPDPATCSTSRAWRPAACRSPSGRSTSTTCCATIAQRYQALPNARDVRFVEESERRTAAHPRRPRSPDPGRRSTCSTTPSSSATPTARCACARRATAGSPWSRCTIVGRGLRPRICRASSTASTAATTRARNRPAERDRAGHRTRAGTRRTAARSRRAASSAWGRP